MKKVLLSFLLNAMITNEEVKANVKDGSSTLVKIKSYNDNGQFYVSYPVDGNSGRKLTGYLSFDDFITEDTLVTILSDVLIKKINKQGFVKRINDDGDIIVFKVTEKANGRLLQQSKEIQLNFELDNETKQINGNLKLISQISAIEIISITGKTYNKFINNVLKVLEHANSINAENMVVSSKDFLKSI